VQKIRIDAYAAAPETVCRRRRRRHALAFWVIVVDSHVVFENCVVGVCGFFVAPKVDADGDDGLKTLAAACHVGHACVGFWAQGVEHEHAEADEGVAEEDCYGEEDHDEEDVNLLAERAVREGDC
jgi:hypothetical protein